MRPPVLLCLLLTSACGGASQAAPPALPPPALPPSGPASASDASDTFPTPYTAEQIRDATHVGRSYTWRVEAGEAPPVEKVVVFGPVDTVGAELVSDGTARRVTWEELRRHAAFPRAAVTTREETIAVPAGTFECVVYVVADRTTGEVSTYYFAKRMPGAPVLFFVDKSGKRTMTSTLIRYRPDAGAP